MTREITLTQGRVALVDDDDYGWLSERRWHYAGRYAGRSSGAKHARAKLWMHREIMAAPDGVLVDHVNGDPLDNRRCNLRLCSRLENNRNVRRHKAKSKSQFKGVFVSGVGRPKASISLDGRTAHIGTFATEVEAARAYDRAAIKHFGEFANLNFTPQRDWLVPQEHVGPWPPRLGFAGAVAAAEAEAAELNLDLFEGRLQ